MLISLYLVRYEHVKIRFKHFYLIDHNASENFVYLCKQTISCIHTIFNTVHAISDMNEIYQLQNILSIFTRVRAYTDRKTECTINF